MNKKFSLVLMVIILLLTGSGCGYKDIDKRFFVVSIGIDPGEKQGFYQVILKLAIPKADAKMGQEEFIILSEETRSIAEAIRIMKSKIDKELDFSHAKMIVLGEGITGKNVAGIMDWFVRRRDIQKIAWVGIGKPNAKKILEIKPRSERLPSNALFLSFGQSGTESEYIISKYLFDFRRRLKERGLDPILPIIEVGEKGEMFTINTSAVFNKHTLKLRLSPEETKLFNSLSSKVRKADIKINKGDIYYFISTDHIRSKFKLHTSADKPYAEFSVHITGIIEESKEEVSENELTSYKKIAEEEFPKRLVALLKKLQKADVDPLGLGLKYRSRHFNNHEEWKEWQTLYPKLDFRVNVTINLRGTGVIK